MTEPLDEAVEALRERVDGAPPPGPDRTRAAILSAARPAPSPWPRVAMAATVLLAVVVGAPAAWASIRGGLGSWFGREVEQAVPRVPPLPSPGPAPPSSARPAPAEAPVPEPAADDVTEAPRREPESLARRARRRGPTPRPSASRPSAPPAPAPSDPASTDPASIDPASIDPASIDPAPTDTVERRAFEAAHRVHFGGGTPSAALRAWDAYLADHPRGRYEPEARYNRALTLVRLGHRQAAVAALRPFAAGRYGPARQASARALLEALDPSSAVDPVNAGEADGDGGVR
jgi:hypothetical protein